MLKKISVFGLLLLLVMSISCDNEPYEGDIIDNNDPCQLAMLASLNASNDFVSANLENYNILCQTYKNALEDQIVICGDINGELQTIIDNLGDCSITGSSPCDLAMAATAAAFEVFLNTTNSQYEVDCMAYVAAIENEIIECGDDGSMQALIDELGDCIPVIFDPTGDWTLVAISSDVARDLDNDGAVSNNYIEEMDCFMNDGATFNADGTGTFFFRSDWEVTYTPDSNNNEANFDVECIVISNDVDFTWVQVGLNSIIVTIVSDGTVFNFFRNADDIFIARRNNFIVTNSTTNTIDIIEDLIYEYEKL